MKCTHIAKGAFALVLGMMTSTVLAENVYEESFEALADGSAIILDSAWTAGADDTSTVVVASYTPPEVVGTPLADPHTKVLQLNTEGGTLTNTLPNGPHFFDTAKLYVDTMVKCVPSEDTPVFNDTAIKVAVYAKIAENGSSTNLAIYHRVYNAGNSYNTNTVTSLSVDAAQWYRLTIELANGGDDPAFQMAKISINGVPVTNAAAYKDTWVNGLGNPDTGPWFFSAATASKDSISQIQFKGTGFIDDLVVTADDPYEQGETPMTLAQATAQWISVNGWTAQDLENMNPAFTAEQLYLLNVAADEGTAEGAITVTGIEIAANGDVSVTVQIDRTMSLGAINGNVCLYGWTALGDTPALVGAADVAGSTLGSNEDLDKTFTFTAAQAAGMKFFKAVIEYPADR